MRLVSLLVDWVAETYFSGDKGHIFIDNPEANPCTRPPPVFGYIPDVFATKKNAFIIGEAKTAPDIERPHSIAQLKAFMAKCSTAKDSVFVLAVPWHAEKLTKNLIRHLAKETPLDGLNAVVLEKLPG